MKRKWILLLLAAVLTLSLVITGCAEKKEKHIIFTTGAWTGDWLTIYVPKIMFEEELGYTTEIADLSTSAAWTAVGIGEADLWTNAWLPNQQRLWDKYDATLESLGLIYGGPDDPCIQFWAIPTWVSEEYGITSVTDLDDPEFVKLFDTDSDGIGDLLGCDPAWGCAVINDDMIAGYELGDLYEQKYGAEIMITAAILGHLKKDEPVLFYMYTPHPLFINYPIGESIFILEDPLEFWAGFAADIHKIANRDWVAENPEAAELLRQVEMTSDDIAWMMAQIEEKGDDAATLEALAREWMAEHQAEVDSWLEAIK